MRRVVLVVAGAAMLSACGSAGNVYDEPLPSRDDQDALLDIRDKLKPEDQKAWQGIVMRMMNPMAEPIRSKTVGEAITKLKAKTACMEAHDTSKVPDGPNDISAPDYEEKNAAHIAAYNKEVDAYNACLKMPV